MHAPSQLAFYEDAFWRVVGGRGSQRDRVHVRERDDYYVTIRLHTRQMTFKELDLDGYERASATKGARGKVGGKC